MTRHPSPAQMAGRKDPALSVRPVDYSSWRPSRPADPAAAGVSGPSAPGREAAASGSLAGRDSATSGPRTGRDAAGRPVPGPGPRTVGRAPQTASAPGAEPGGVGSVEAHDSSPAARAERELSVDPVIAGYVAALRRAVGGGGPAPEHAVYTSTEDSAPELEVPASGISVDGPWQVTEAQLRAVVAEPEDVWSADLGRSDYYVRGPWCVQVLRASHRVIGLYRSGWALARRPDETWADGPDDVLGTGPKPGGSGTRYPTNRRELLSRLKRAGFHVTTSGPTHGKITHPDVPGRFLPYSSTPSSQRYGRHVTTAVNRVFGIDLRERG